MLFQYVLVCYIHKYIHKYTSLPTDHHIPCCSGHQLTTSLSCAHTCCAVREPDPAGSVWFDPVSAGMPPRKDQVERQAWQWAETTPPEEVGVEHMLTAYILQPPHNRKTACKSVLVLHSLLPVTVQNRA